MGINILNYDGDVPVHGGSHVFSAHLSVSVYDNAKSRGDKNDNYKAVVIVSLNPYTTSESYGFQLKGQKSIHIRLLVRLCQTYSWEEILSYDTPTGTSEEANWPPGTALNSKIIACNKPDIPKFELTTDINCPDPVGHGHEFGKDMMPVPIIHIHTVNYYDGHTGSLLKSESVTHGQSGNPPTIPNYDGYSSNGWNSDAWRNVQSDLNITCTYTELQYKVSYDLQGGSGNFPKQTKYGASNLTLHGAQPTRTFTIRYERFAGNGYQTHTYNYAFGGWKSSSDAQTYSPGSTYSKNADTTLQAIWNPIYVNTDDEIPEHNKVITVKEDWQDGRNGAKDTTKSHDVECPFLGWFSSTTSTTKLGTFNVGKNMTVYGRWDDALVLESITNPSKDHWNFKGWYKDPKYTQKVDNTTKSGVNITIYAKWSYDVTFHANGGYFIVDKLPTPGHEDETNMFEKVDKIKEHNVLLSTNIDVRHVVKTIRGWSRSSSATSVEFSHNSSYDINDAADLYAVWGTPSFTVTFRTGFGSNEIISQVTVELGHNVPSHKIPIYRNTYMKNGKLFERTGYAGIAGWSQDTNNIRGDITIEALWDKSPIWIYVEEGGKRFWAPYLPEEK